MKPWEERWESESGTRGFIDYRNEMVEIPSVVVRRKVGDGPSAHWVRLFVYEPTAGCSEAYLEGQRAIARLIAAAPAMARALCLVEWSYEDMCQSCHGSRPDHFAACPLDAALTAAGLDAAAREAVRQKEQSPTSR